jgi:hypothetical protein
MTTRSRIAWTEEEQRQIVEAACDILEKNSFVSFISLLREAQKTALFPNRIRNIQAITTVPWFKPRVERVMKERQSVVKKQEAIPVVVSVNAESVSTDELLAEVLKRLLIKPMRNELQSWFESSHVVSRLSSEIVSGLRGCFKQVESTNSVQAKPALRKILIVGLLNEQRQVVQKEWNDLLDLKFCEGNNPNLADLAKKSDVAVIMTKFISHGAQNTIKNTGVQLAWCNGSVSDLGRVLEDLFNKLS